MAHFQTLITDTKKYSLEIQILQQEFGSLFQDFREHATAFILFSTPFNVNVEIISDEFQMEITELRYN
jgi:hypothetical protein